MRRVLGILAVFVSVTKRFYRQVIATSLARRLLNWCRRYSTQLSFSSIVLVFLTASVGEAQQNYSLLSEYEPTIVEELLASANSGFIGKPQVFGGQTVLTGEIQIASAILYVVEPGDSIVSIAKRYDLSVGTILKENNIEAADSEKIKSGTELLIPPEDSDTSLAWLNTINIIKEEERKKAEAARQRQLALAEKEKKKLFGRTTAITTRSTSTSGYDVITTLRGGYNGGYPGQCTWYVNYKRPGLPNGMGNGGQYLSNARAKGLSTGSVARPGSLIVTTENAYYGHVAYVESVSGNNVTITEMNYAGPYIVTRRTLSANDPVIKGYVY